MSSLFAPFLLALISAVSGSEPTANAGDCVKARQQQSESAASVCRSALTLARERNDHSAALTALFQLAILAREAGRYAEAERLHAEIQRTPEFSGQWLNQYRLAREQGILAHVRRNSSSALTFFRGALALASQHDDPALIARSHNDLGNAYRHIGAHQEALDAYTTSLEMKRNLGEEQLGSTLNNIADLLTDLGDLGRAEDFYEQALTHHRRADAHHHVAHSTESLARLLAEQERGEEAMALAREAYATFQKMDRPPDEVRTAVQLAGIADGLERQKEVTRWLETARATATLSGIDLPPRWFSIQARRLAASGQADTALALLEGALEEASAWPGDRRLQILEQVADLHEETGDLEAALAWHRRYNTESLARAQRERDRELNRSRVLFEVSEKQREIERLAADNRMQDLELANQRNRSALIAIGGATGMGSILLVAVGLHRRRNRREAERRERLQQVIEGHKASARSLRTSREQLQQLLDLGTDALLSLDANDRIVFANQAACRLLELDSLPEDSTLDQLFGEGTWQRLQAERRDVAVTTGRGTELRLDLEPLNLEEELQVVNIRTPDQHPHAAEELIPLINRHFSRIQSFGSVLQAALEQGGIQGDLYQRWASIDGDLQLLSEQLQPVQQDIRGEFRQDLVELMAGSLETWERATGKTRVDLAESSGIWRVTIDEGRLRTRAMDRYLSLAQLPKQPRWREVLRTAYFVLGECAGEDDGRIEAGIEKVKRNARRLGLA
ncbi:tetratricopeptide repeat protein [Wenzhouxiangella sediminis]|uniref:PAS domain-containing protein n=1 Tax=Wenzhouxiangella sediminis TaxID=1792836 RepID=A0A3E1KBW4_9GAMM|nr:tetratricopeptide repeat protein [Wenzhouxiangella sediminis]RFF31545.1 PAS domain-containing protein [Wenzhouxiangella sediminis]